MKRITALLLCAAMVAGLLAGCAQEKQPHVPTGDGLSWENETQAVATSPTTAEEEEQAIVMAFYPDVSMNPFLCADYTNRTLFSLIYQSLFVTDQNYEVKPILCQRYRVSEDLKTYTIYPETNARFSDGDPLTVNDVLLSLKAAMEDESYYAGRFRHVETINSAADGSVVIQLDTPYEDFTRLLDIPIVKAEETGSLSPLGTGPYVFAQLGPDAALMRNPNWWCSAELPINASTIPLRIGTGPVDIRDQFEFSDVSLVCADPGSDSYADYRCDYELWDCENGIFVYLGCNTEEGVFANKTVRSALTYAIDREILADGYYRDFAEPVTLPCSPMSPWYDDLLASKYEYQANKFGQAVKKAAMNGQRIKLLVNKDDTLRLQVASAIAQMLNTSGLVVELVERNSEDYFTDLQYKDYDLYLGQTRLSPNMDLTEFFYENGKLSFGPMNDETMYALCLKSLENSGNFYDLHQMIMNDGRLCPLLYRSYAVYATRGMIDDLHPSRDNVFYYDLGRTQDDALQGRTAETTDPTDPDGTVPETTEG